MGFDVSSNEEALMQMVRIRVPGGSSVPIFSGTRTLDSPVLNIDSEVCHIVRISPMVHACYCSCILPQGGSHLFCFGVVF